ncbi:MAG: leucyl aminopeptidase family protein, partial [Sulfuricella sp.]
MLPPAKSFSQLEGAFLTDVLRARMQRRGAKLDSLKKAPMSGDLQQGALAAWVMIDPEQSAFEQHTAMRKALELLLAEKPSEIVIAVSGTPEQRRLAAKNAVYCTLVNSALLPERKKKDARKALQKITLFGHQSEDAYRSLRAQAAGNTLAHELTMLPANDLTPGLYRERIRKLAKESGWKCEEF